MHKEGKFPALASTFESKEDAIRLIADVLLDPKIIAEIEQWLTDPAEEPRHTFVKSYDEATGHCVVHGRDFNSPFELHGVAVVLMRSRSASYEVLTAFPYNTVLDNTVIFPSW